ncbi:uncharacterized protein LOC120650674 isoform X2 [Panicum virgatum]|uniref:uncharacterized protein LOC120650674 isoform X2 n=1 Tax=Panicum virgatum TaxID=38727 RepID=UPI0019D651B4|nr:uncharacterized protein LOC120650674 isoform X2 [Panicum virgatum]
MASSSESLSSDDTVASSSESPSSSDDDTMASSSEPPSSGDDTRASSSESPSDDNNTTASSAESLGSDDNNTPSSSEIVSSDDNKTASSSESRSSDDEEKRGKDVDGISGGSTNGQWERNDRNDLRGGHGGASERPDDRGQALPLPIQKGNPAPQISRAQKLADSWRTIQQLKSLVRKEYGEDTMFLCRVSLIAIDCTSGWCYLGCDTCHKSMYDAPRKCKCRRCGPIKRPVYWYKLNTKVKDATCTMNLMIFCEVAEDLVGVSADELIDKIKNDDEWFTMPNKIRALLGSMHTFQVFDKYRNGRREFLGEFNHGPCYRPSTCCVHCSMQGGACP